jgi:hypothetical protein
MSPKVSQFVVSLQKIELQNFHQLDLLMEVLSKLMIFNAFSAFMLSHYLSYLCYLQEKIPRF